MKNGYIVAWEGSSFEGIHRCGFSFAGAAIRVDERLVSSINPNSWQPIDDYDHLINEGYLYPLFDNANRKTYPSKESFNKSIIYGVSMSNKYYHNLACHHPDLCTGKIEFTEFEYPEDFQKFTASIIERNQGVTDERLKRILWILDKKAFMNTFGEIDLFHPDGWTVD